MVTPPLHLNCRCAIVPVETVLPGDGTKEGENGADYWLVHYGRLPESYISGGALRALGWRPGKPVRRYAPGRMYAKGVYENKNGHLPSAPWRVWYEADLNYYEGLRNGHRILYSNDGLFFVTYDHYRTFYEIVTGGEA